MRPSAGTAVERSLDMRIAPSFGEWAAQELERLIRARSAARTAEERTQVELQIATVYGAAQRFGRSLADSAEL